MTRFETQGEDQYRSRAAMLVAAVIGQIGLGLAALAGVVPLPSPTALAVAVLVALLSLILLSRTTLANVLRLGLSIGLILIMILVVLRADPYSMDPVREAVDETAINETAAASLESSAAPPRADAQRGQSGARLSLEPGRGGDGGWAGALSSRFGTTLGGDAAGGLSIHGKVTIDREPDWERLKLRWSIDDGVRELPCGDISIRFTLREQVFTQIRAAFERAIAHSLAQDAPACF